MLATSWLPLGALRDNPLPGGSSRSRATYDQLSTTVTDRLPGLGSRHLRCEAGCVPALTGYLGPSAPSFPGLLAEGRFDVAGLVVAVVLLVPFLLAIRARRRTGDGWPRRRSASYLVGVLAWLICTVGPVAFWARVLAWAQAVQVRAVLLAVPMLLACGRPLELAAARRGDRRRPPSPAAGRWLRVVGSPLLSPLFVPVVLGLLWATPLLLTVDRHPAAVGLMCAGLLAVGMLLALGLVGDDTGQESSLVLAAATAVGLLELHSMRSRASRCGWTPTCWAPRTG